MDSIGTGAAAASVATDGATGDAGGESSSSSRGVSFPFETFPFRSLDRLFWNQTYRRKEKRLCF